MKVLPTILILCYFRHVLQTLGFYQDDYTVKQEILQLVDYNRSYLRNPKADYVWYNRTTRAINISFYLLKDIGTQVQTSWQVYKFLSNEYRLFPLYLKQSFCEHLESDPFAIIQSLRSSVNFIISCPLKKGFYALKHGIINFTRFPRHLLGGRYRCEMKVFDHSNFIVTLYFDVEITEVLKKWEY